MARELKATVRQELGRRALKRLRESGSIPGVIYRGGQVGTNLAFAANEWQKLLNSGQRVVTLKLQGGDRQALIKDVQYDAFGEVTLHVDFNELREGEKVRVAVSVTTKGVPKGQLDGGQLQQPVHTVHVECLPTDIPDRIVLDVSNMAVDDVIHAKDLQLAKGVTVLEDAQTVIAAVHMPRVEEVAATPAEGAPAEPEVLTEKKEEAPAEGEAAAAGKPEKKAEKKEEKK